MKIGANTVSGLYLGSTAASRAYLGASLVWEADSGFNPTSLFASGEPGGIWLPEPQYLFQDRAGTVPVTASGQSVGYRLDISGRGNHLTAINDAARGTYNTDGTLHWIAYDGVDDSYVSPTITPSIDRMQFFAGIRKLSDEAVSVIMESSTSFFATNGSFGVFAPMANGQQSIGVAWRGNNGGNPAQSPVATYSPYAAPLTYLVSHQLDLSQTTFPTILKTRLDGSDLAASSIGGSSVTGSGGNFLAYPVYVGRRGGSSNPFNGRDYGLIVRFGPNLDLATIQHVEAYLAARTGVTL
jgi:hypothetical protein